MIILSTGPALLSTTPSVLVIILALVKYLLWWVCYNCRHKFFRSPVFQRKCTPWLITVYVAIAILFQWFPHISVLMFLADNYCNLLLFRCKNIFVQRKSTKAFYANIILQRKFFCIGWLPATHKYFPNCCCPYIYVVASNTTCKIIFVQFGLCENYFTRIFFWLKFTRWKKQIMVEVGTEPAILSPYLQMEAKIIMSRLLNSFTVHLPSGYVLKVVQRTTLKPADKVPCTLELTHVDLQ